MSEERVEQLFGALNSAPAEPDPAFVARLARRVQSEATEGAVSSIAPTDEYMGEPIMINLDTKTTEQTPTEQRPRWQPSASVMRWAAALVLFIGVAGGVIFAAQDDTPTNVASEGPIAVVDLYFDAFNAGDVDAVLLLLTPEATLTERFGSVGEFSQLDRLEWEQELTDSLAQETVLTPHDCTEANDPPAGVTIFVCEYGLRNALTQAVDAPSIPVITTFSVTPAGKINEIQVNYNEAETGIDFVHVGRPFGQWMQANHPEFAGLATTDQQVQSCCESMSPTETGLLIAQYAQEWAAYLEANDCTYLDGC